MTKTPTQASVPPNPTVLQVALAVPVGDFFDYLYPDVITPVVGCRVLVPFGRRQLIGIVIGITDLQHSQAPLQKLKPIISLIDQTPLIDASLQQLASWLSNYYHHPLGEVYAVMLPSLIGQGQSPNPEQHFWQLKPNACQTGKLSPKQAWAIQVLQTNPQISQEQLSQLGIQKNTLLALEKRALIQGITQKPSQQAVTLKQEPLTANDQQKQALETISQAYRANRYQGFLLHGVTGSGKTEVYLQAMQEVLADGKQVLILVPEIGLTPQTRQRFDDRFFANICVLHSGMSDQERLQGWEHCRTGIAQVIISTRSGILYPFKNLGLIIVDEAHDGSYKQQDHLRYHACDVAMVRALFTKIPIILGTATPSLEQYKLVHEGKLSLLPLNNRAGQSKLAKLRLVDSRLDQEWVLLADGVMTRTVFAKPTIHAIRQRLSAGEQVLVFLNRRGYSPILLCQACGWQADCPNCDAHLTMHKSPVWHQGDFLRCHHCGYQTTLPKNCPGCHSPNLEQLGAGTSRLTEQLHALFCNPQTNQNTYPVIQIDRDTVRKKGAWEKILDTINSQEPAILVGTQMIAKGHHFANVTLVVVVDADLGFLSADFRSPEHTAQRIIQVAGRAGRDKKAGDVYIQTLQPNNPLLLKLVKTGYDAFAKDLLAERQVLGLPPFSYAALVVAESPHYDKAKNAIIAASNLVPKDHPFAIIAPVDAPMTKKQNRYFVQMLILSKQRSDLHAFLDIWWPQVLKSPSSQGIKIKLDIDPLAW